jgi:transcription initiation factor TFIIIB Brf1 subunit/transcription initiation factor TFIIB
LSVLDKERLWSILDNDRNNHKNTENKTEQTTASKLEDLFDKCYKCESKLIYTEEGFPTCTNESCGIMNTNTIDYSPEWRFFAADSRHTNDPTRCGNPIDPLLEESSYACKVICKSNASYEMKNIRKWAKWQSMPHKEKALYDEFQLITVMAQNAGIPKMFIDHAKTIYKDLYEQKTFRGVKRDSIRAASIWIACWKNDCPRTSNEIAEIFKIDKNSASLGCSLAEEMLQSHERTMDDSNKSQLCAMVPSLFIERFCSKMNMPPELILLAKFISNKVETQNIIPDNRPQAIAAGIMYFISYYCNMEHSKIDIKHILGDEVSEVTINKCFQKLDEYRSQFLPSWVSQKYKTTEKTRKNKK